MVTLRISTVDKWFMMPHASTSYGFQRGLTYQTHKDYIADAIAAADNEVHPGRATGALLATSHGVLWACNPSSRVPLASGTRLLSGCVRR